MTPDDLPPERQLVLCAFPPFHPVALHLMQKLCMDVTATAHIAAADWTQSTKSESQKFRCAYARHTNVSEGYLPEQEMASVTDAVEMPSI